MMLLPDRLDPFLCRITNWQGNYCGAVDAVSRLSMVGTFTELQCYRALLVPGLQGTVRTAIERRMRKIWKGVYS
jgi:hypothetical protein